MRSMPYVAGGAARLGREQSCRGPDVRGLPAAAGRSLGERDPPGVDEQVVVVARAPAAVVGTSFEPGRAWWRLGVMLR